MTGCASNNPEWLAQPSGAFCADALTEKCLKAFAEKAYTESTARVVSNRNLTDQSAVEPSPSSQAPSNEAEVERGGEGADGVTATPSEGHGAKEDSKPQLSEDLPDDLDATPHVKEDIPPHPDASAERTDNHEGSIPTLALGVAAIGASAADADGFVPSEAVTHSLTAGSILNQDGFSSARISEAQTIHDKALRSEVLASIVTLHANSLSEEQTNDILNDLYALDKGQYGMALIVKLPGLLKEGDLERAAALRDALMEASSMPRYFSMLAYVASCYSMAGLKDDAGAIVRKAYADGRELSADDRKLIAMAINLGDGHYPMLQEFYDYQSDEARLHAYLTLTVIARQFDRKDIATRAMGDAVRFIQKSSVKLDRVRALGLILSLTPGVI